MELETSIRDLAFLQQYVTANCKDKGDNKYITDYAKHGPSGYTQALDCE